MAKYGKRLRKAYDGLDVTKSYSLVEAITLIKSKASTKFDETLNIAVNLNIDTRKAEQNIRTMIQLPSGTGKTVRVAVFARGPKADEAKAAGAECVGAEDLMEEVLKGTVNFDRCIATPDMMGIVGRLGKVLGPKGLMPNPKLGTVTMDVAKAVDAAKGGQVELRAEKAGIVHAGIGKLSFSDQKLVDNVKAVIDALDKAKPSGVKGTYMKKVSLSSTMGIGLAVDMASSQV